MRPVAKNPVKIGVLLLLVSVLLSGCIVCIDDVFCDGGSPRMAMLHVYARDYFTGTPIPWAQVELYESDWWTWDYQGTWPMNQAGYAAVPCGYMYYDGRGGPEEEDFRVIVYAPGYAPEGYDIELSYYYPSEILTFYLMPYMAREGEDAEPGVDPEEGDIRGAGAARSLGRVEIGETGATVDE